MERPLIESLEDLTNAFNIDFLIKNKLVVKCDKPKETQCETTGISSLESWEYSNRKELNNE